MSHYNKYHISQYSDKWNPTLAPSGVGKGFPEDFTHSSGETPFPSGSKIVRNALQFLIRFNVYKKIRYFTLRRSLLVCVCVCVKAY